MENETKAKCVKFSGVFAHLNVWGGLTLEEHSAHNSVPAFFPSVQ